MTLVSVGTLSFVLWIFGLFYHGWIQDREVDLERDFYLYR